MGRLHEGRRVDADIDRIARDARRLAKRIRGEASADGGLAHDALQESVEAILLSRTLEDAPFPAPSALGVPPEAYLGGLADLVGEMRRLALEALARGELPEARRLLERMDAIHRTLARFESPRAIMALKPKQDQARALVERTRGDVALAGVLDRAGAHARPPESEEP